MARWDDQNLWRWGRKNKKGAKKPYPKCSSDTPEISKFFFLFATLNSPTISVSPLLPLSPCGYLASPPKKNEDLPPSVLSPTEKDPCFPPLKLLFSFFLFSLIPCSYLPWQATPSFPVPHIRNMASSHPMASQSSLFPGWSEK